MAVELESVLEAWRERGGPGDVALLGLDRVLRGESRKAMKGETKKNRKDGRRHAF